MINHFNSNVAVQFNLNIAIFIQQLSQWTFNNLANKRNLHDGFCWSYNTLEAYEIIFPWWNRRQLETLISNLVKEGLIVKGNYNKHKYDRTCWYALTYKAMEFYPELIRPEFLELMLGTISQKCEMEIPDYADNTILQNHFTKMRNGVHENVTPIPTNITTKDISKDISVSSSESVNEEDHIKIPKPKKGTFGIIELKADNPHEIEEGMLSDFLEVRKAKKNKVTGTAWNKINKTLTLIKKEIGVSPKEAFETMVTRGWQSIELEYFQNTGNGHAGKNTQGGEITDSSGQKITWE